MYTGIVRESKSIVKCYDEMYGDIMISDELRKLLLLDDSDNYEVYSEKDRSEFLFRIFKHICLGGSVCQVIFDCVTLTHTYIRHVYYSMKMISPLTWIPLSYCTRT